MEDFEIDGDYPSEASLNRIEKWPIGSFEDTHAVLDFVKSLWHWPDFGVSHELRAEEALVVGAESGQRFLRLATGGWSGNESIISAMEGNRLLHAFTWRLDALGGLHIYAYPVTAKTIVAEANAERV